MYNIQAQNIYIYVDFVNQGIYQLQFFSYADGCI